MTEDNNNEVGDKVQEQISSDTNSSQELETNNSETDVEGQKRLEEKEHYELEFFSKEELVKKNEDLEKQLKEVKEKLEKVEKEMKDSKNKYMHLQAEFENAQKRWDKNRQNLRIEYTSSVLKSFLPLYDSFRKAIESSNDTEKKVLTGFFNQFMNIYKSYSAEPIKVNVNDQFDYNLHEALSTIEKDDIPENSVVEVIQDGFKYGKEVIRYAKVIISRKPKPPKPEPKEEEVEKEESDKNSSDDQKTNQDRPVEKKEKKHKKQKKEDN